MWGWQIVPGNAPSVEQLQEEHEPSSFKPYEPLPQESQRWPLTPGLQSHCPPLDSQNWLREPRGSQSHGMQPSGWDRFQKPNSHRSQERPEGKNERESERKWNTRESWDLLRELNKFLKWIDACFTTSIYPHSAGVCLCLHMCIHTCVSLWEKDGE